MARTCHPVRQSVTVRFGRIGQQPIDHESRARPAFGPAGRSTGPKHFNPSEVLAPLLIAVACSKHDRPGFHPGRMRPLTWLMAPQGVGSGPQLPPAAHAVTSLGRSGERGAEHLDALRIPIAHSYALAIEEPRWG
jgi:hypothetical protein